MTKLSGRQQELLGLLQANYAGGVVFSRRTAVPKLFWPSLRGLRIRGLIDPDSFRPTTAGISSSHQPEAARKKRGAWDADRKRSFLAALGAPGATVAEALLAVGLSARSKARFQDARRADCTFDQAVTELLGSRSTRQRRSLAPRPDRVAAPTPRCPETNDDDLTPFERQLRAVENGARVIPKFRPPNRSYADTTLGGVASY